MSLREFVTASLMPRELRPSSQSSRGVTISWYGCDVYTFYTPSSCCVKTPLLISHCGSRFWTLLWTLNDVSSEVRMIHFSVEGVLSLQVWNSSRGWMVRSHWTLHWVHQALIWWGVKHLTASWGRRWCSSWHDPTPRSASSRQSSDHCSESGCRRQGGGHLEHTEVHCDNR